VAEVCHDKIPAAGDDGRPGLSRALCAVEEGLAHLLVALDEGQIADDAGALGAVHFRVPRIEYAQLYADHLQLLQFVEVMKQIAAIPERPSGPGEGGGDGERT
jgi:hypothetical protein